MQSESQSLNSQIIGIDVNASNFVVRPVSAEDRERLLKIRQMYVDAGKLPPLKADGSLASDTKLPG